MATITATSIINKAGIILQDTAQTRWDEDELQGWLNDGQRAIVLLKPDAYPVIEDVTCAAGTKQTIPAGGICLLNVIRNMGAAGATPGRAVILGDADIMNVQKHGWHSAPAGTEALHFFFDKRFPKDFYIYPAIGTGHLEIVYAASPADCASSGNAWANSHDYALGDKFTEAIDSADYVFEVVKAGTSNTEPSWPAIIKECVADAGGVIYQNIGKTLLTLDDFYEGILLDYMLYRAYLKDSETMGNEARAASYLRSFLSMLGLQDEMEKLIDPHVANLPITPAVRQALQAQ